MAVYRIGDDTPRIDPSAWIADNATVIGRVTLAAGTSVWYGAVLRGDNDAITIGRDSNVQDGCVLHTDPGWPLTLGDQVSVGHQVMLHGCTVGDGTLVGIQSVLLNGAKIGRHSIVGAGSLVTEGKEFPDGALIVGRPAKLVRMLTPEEHAAVLRSAAIYVDKAARHRAGLVRIA